MSKYFVLGLFATACAAQPMMWSGTAMSWGGAPMTWGAAPVARAAGVSEGLAAGDEVSAVAAHGAMATETLVASDFATGLSSSQAHSATISIVDGLNPPGTTTYSVYRAPGACGAAPLAGPPLVTGLTELSYTDSTIALGTYCYAVTATVLGAESQDSNLAAVSVQPFPVTITVVAK